jgi:hypothetical protein
VIAVIVILGVYPKPLFDVINPAVHSSFSKVRSHDPSPSRPPAVLRPDGPVEGANQLNSTGATP